MISLVRRFLHRIFSACCSETAVCEQCGAVASKTRMYHYSLGKWVCNEEEAHAYWASTQW